EFVHVRDALEYRAVRIPAAMIALSPREMECLTWAAKGKTYSDIAAILGLSFATVKVYLDASRYKLHASNLVHAAAIAVARGLIDMGADRVPRLPAMQPQQRWVNRWMTS